MSDTLIPAQDLSPSTYLDLLPNPNSVSTIEYDPNVVSQTRWPTAPFEALAPSLSRGIEQPYPHSTDPSISSLEVEASIIGADATSFEFLNTLNPSSFEGSSNSPSTTGNSEVTDLSFPDSYYLPVNELTLLRGLMRIAVRLRCNTTTIWDLRSNSPFNDGTHTALTTQDLPQTWRPTLSQSSIPHHPVIDLLPWPSVRDRLLLLISLPDEARPAALSGPRK